MEISPFLHNETRLLVIDNEIVQITFKLHNESDNLLYTENDDLQGEIKQIIIGFVKFMDEDHIVDGEGYYLLCKKSIWSFGRNCVFCKNDQVIPPHQYKYNFELEFVSQVINRNAGYDRGRNKSITDEDKNNNFISRQMDDNFGTPKSSNNAINQEMIQRMTSGANISPLENWDMKQRATTGFSSSLDNRQSMSIFAESTRTELWVNRNMTQRPVNNAYMTPFDNQKQIQKPVDSAYATLFNYRGPIQRSTKNAYTTPINKQKFAIDTRSTSSFANLEYPESIQQSLFGYQEALNDISGTSKNPILIGETFEQASRASQESSTRVNWPSQNSRETTLSLDSELQKVSGISKSQFQPQTRQISNISYSMDDFSNNSFIDSDEPSVQNASDNRLLNERENTQEANGNFEDNRILSFLSPLNFIRRMFSGYLRRA